MPSRRNFAAACEEGKWKIIVVESEEENERVFGLYHLDLFVGVVLSHFPRNGNVLSFAWHAHMLR